MNRQLQADGGIMQVAPREKFGLGSSIKKFVRKIIPNEVAEVAVKAAPFVAPFNPLLAAGMSGIGSFDQTGRIGDSLKGGALTYGLGQGARYLGGADFQGLQNPFAKDAFSMPTGSGGIKNLFKSDVQPVQAINEGQSTFGQDLTQDLIGGDTVSSVDSIGDTGSTFSNFFDYGKDLLKKGAKAAFYDKNGKLDKAAVIGVATAAASYAEALALAKNAGVELTEEEYNQAQADEKREEYAGYLQNFFGGKKDGGRIGFKDGSDPGDIVLASDSDSELIKAGKFSRVVRVLMDEGFDFAEAVKEAMRQGYNQGGRIGFESGANKTIEEKIAELESLTNKLMTEQGIQDRGYASRLASDIINMKNESIDPDRLKFLNNESSLFALPRDIRPEDEYYDTLKALEKRANGGRIGFESGANEMIKTQLLEEIMPEQDGEEMITIMTEDGPIQVKKSVYESMPNMFKDTTTGFGANITRVDRKFGSPKEGESEIGIMAIDVEAGDDDEDEEDMMMAGITFSRPEKSYLFRRLGGSGGSDRSYTMPNLYKILSNPNKYPEDAAILKEIAIMGLGEGRKDGGRIGYVKGGNRVSELLILRDGLLANGEDVSDIEAEIFQLTGKTFKSVGGISNIPTGKMRENNAGVVERDYRDEGGFVPVGIKERADDVPAMLSKNEFVMTADAVRGIGNGSVEEGSKKLYNTMKKAEQVGKA